MDAASTSTENIVQNWQVTQSSADTSNSSDQAEDVGLVKTLSTESKAEQQLVLSPSSDVQDQACGTTNVSETPIQVIKGGSERLHELSVNVSKIKDKTSVILELISMNNKLMSEINQLASENKNQLAEIALLQQDLASKQDGMMKLQIQSLDRQVQLRNSVQALLTQTYELYENPIPRLFIVLPDDRSSWNSLDFFSNKFRLYFLCECGEHTKAAKSNIPHRIHLAKHEGYDIEHPNEFFQQYGSNVLTILKMLKFGISVAGVAVPALSNLIPDALDQATESLKLLTMTIEPGMDQVINHIEKISTDEGGVVDRSPEQIENNEAFEGADLRQLETFLKNKNKNRALGNLYRTVTIEGHVKWVCIDHYRENYHEKAANAFRDSVQVLGGSFNENIGRVELRLSSKVEADQFYAALEKARSVYELKVELDWEVTQSDFKKLRDTLALTNVGALEVYLGQQDEPTRDIVNRSQRYDLLLDIMRHRSIQSFTIGGSQDFGKRSSIQSRNDDFSNLRHLDISLNQSKDDILGVKCLVAKAPNLSSLALGTNTGYTVEELRSKNDYLVQAYHAIVEHQTYPITFKEWNLRVPPLPKEPNRSIDVHQCKEHLFQDYWESTSEVTLDGDTLGSSDLDEFAKTEDSPGFQTLRLQQADLLGKRFINNLSSIVARSELHTLAIYTRENEGRVRILESIQWTHLRTLWILLKPGTFETSVMRVLVDGVKRLSGKVELELFQLYSESNTPLNMPQEDLLLSFAALTSIEKLALEVVMTLEQMLSLFKSTDFSRLEILKMWTQGFNPDKVDAIIDGLQHATKLRNLVLVDANITIEQKRRMEANGINLSNT
jgi:hypothetical protein